MIFVNLVFDERNGQLSQMGIGGERPDMEIADGDVLLACIAAQAIIITQGIPRNDRPLAMEKPMADAFATAMENARKGLSLVDMDSDKSEPSGG